MRLFSTRFRFNTQTAAWIVLFILVAGPVAAQQAPRPRVVITADPELDDNNSLIRFLLYSSDVTIEGLIYASSGFHWKGDGKGTKWFVPGREYARFGLDTCPCPSWRWAPNERFIHTAVNAYARVYPNLKKHNPAYPAPQLLQSKIRFGNIAFDGDYATDSPGSDLIKALLLDDKPGPLFITAWGGQSTIARALKSIEEQYRGTKDWPALKEKISRKAVLLPSGDQDDTYALYIKPAWPGIEYRTFTNGPNYGYGAQLQATPENAPYLTPAWMFENVVRRGPLGALYRVWGDGKQMVAGDKLDYFGLKGFTNEQLKAAGYVVWMPVQAPGAWLGEGDNPTFMNLLANGLRAFEKDSRGGWGGRPTTATQGQAFLMPAGDTSQQAMVTALSTANQNDKTDSASLPDFFAAAQRDFAARLLWSVTPRYAGANHAPVVIVQGPQRVLAAPGETIRLNAAISDPDGNAVTSHWWVFAANATFQNLHIATPNAPQTNITIPTEATAGQELHLVLAATDNGTPALTSYQRIVVVVRNTKR